MKMSKKALSAAITLSLVLGVYGVAMAGGSLNLYGAGTDATSPNNNIYLNNYGENLSTESGAVVIANKVGETQTYVTSNNIQGFEYAATGADYKVTGGTWTRVFGGLIQSGNATGNTVTISDGTVNGSTGTVIGYSVAGAVFGGLSIGGTASNNTVNISDGTIGTATKNANVYGGYSYSGTASGNTVTISGGTVSGSVGGGYSYTGTGNVSSNTVTISGGTVNKYVYGGWSLSSGTASGNTVTISGGEVSNVVVGGQSDYGNASGNTVTINETTGTTSIAGSVYGGCAFKGSGAASSNEVEISGGSITGTVYGGYSNGGKSEENTINISGGTITGDVYGGYAKNENGEAEAEENTVNISGGTITGNVYGGYAYSTSSKFELEENTINLGVKNGTGKATIGGDVYLNAATTDGTTITSQSGGTLNVYSVGNTIGKNLHVDGANVNFYIPKTAVTGDTMLTVAGTADLTGANVAAGVQTGSKLKKGDTITLIDATKIDGTIASKKTMTEAGYNKYELGIDVVNNEDLVATVLKAGAGENAKSPLETMAASMSMLNMGGDMLATEGLESAVAAAKAGNAQSEVFAAIGNSNARVNSGSHVDVNGTTFNLGFAKAIANKSGKLVIGPVVEYGTGSYDSYLDNGYHGDGKSKYWGVGLVAKQLNDTGVYYEGSLRGGKVTNDYSAADGSFDSSALYIAAHLGLGKVFQLNEKNNVDVYGKYFFTHQGGDNVIIDGNEFDFKNANSNRARLGARYNYNINAKNTLYGGLALQYEFSGEAAGSMGEDSIEAPSLKGHTGILELGWKVAPTKTFEMKLGMSAYTGVERGGSASVKLNWKF